MPSDNHGKVHGSLGSNDSVIEVSSKGSEVFPPPQRLLRPLQLPARLLMGPGPSNLSPRVQATASLQVLGHRSPEFVQVLNDVQEGIRFAFQTKNEWTLAFSGTGNAAMEATVLNILEPGDVLLVCENGVWGNRYAMMAELHGAVVKRLTRPKGQVFTLEEIDRELLQHKPSAVFIVYGESTGGTLQPLEGLGDLCHKYGSLLIVDAVAALGACPLFMDAWHIDVLFAATQKALSAPPSLSPISFSQRARDKITDRKTNIRSYYYNVPDLANHWGCDGKPRGFHHTEMITSIFALREALAALAEEGLEKSWKKHQECADILYEGLEQLGVDFLVTDKAIRHPCVTPVRVPDDISRSQVSDYILEHYSMEVPGGIGDELDKYWRIGIMGYNSTPDNVKLVLKAFAEAFGAARKK